MKRIITAGLVLLMVGLVGAPGYTLETKVTGTFTYDGVIVSVDDDDVDNKAYREMELELLTQTKITDKITLHSQTAILDSIVDSGDDYDGDNLSVERVWADILTPVGLLSIGRMEISTWGTTFADNEDDGDRIKLVTPMAMGSGKLYLAAVAEKRLEVPAYNNNKEDNEVYYLTATYATRTFATGVLLGLYDYGTYNPDAPGMEMTTYAIVPYFKGMAGPLMIEAELTVTTGSFDNVPIPGLPAPVDIDREGLNYWLEVGYPMGGASVELGYAYVSGDDTSTADTNEGASGSGLDWEKLMILASDDLGYTGPLVDNEGAIGPGTGAGFSLFYLSGSYKASESLSFDGIVGIATADEAAGDDDMGVEIDLGLGWKIMDNLEYNANFGYLMTGDYFATGFGDFATTEASDVIGFYNEIVISF